MEEIAKVMFDNAWTFWSLALSNFSHFDVFKELDEPQIGDYVFEVTNPFAPHTAKIGKLLEKPSTGEYIIEKIDGKTMHWENAKMVKIADEKTRSLIKK